MSGQLRFIADVMLGSLAKWLRILGFDTSYFRTIDDNEIIRIAKQEQRVLLTRDTRLVKSKKVSKHILIKANDMPGQLKEVLKSLPLAPHGSSTCPLSLPFTRCSKCNGELEFSDKESVSGNVPEHVFLNFDSFLRCGDCGKVYWEGSHKKLIDGQIRKVLGEIDTHWKISGNG
ncbi:MAG: Mut7-C RNAse domain-containing protein [Nitrospirae bacterium]|nr:Mut7-C RNAse domain-containing protein [Nitrospirota bacterium]